MTRRYLRRLLAATCAAGRAGFDRGRAQQKIEEATLINWWYSATFGTGFYKIGPAVATVVRLPFSYRLLEMEGGTVGVNLLAPVTVAAYHLNLHELKPVQPPRGRRRGERPSGRRGGDPDDRALRLKPFAQAGMGTEFTDPRLVASMYTGG